MYWHMASQSVRNEWSGLCAIHTKRRSFGRSLLVGGYMWPLQYVLGTKEKNYLLLYLLNRRIGKCGIYLHKIVQSFLDNWNLQQTHVYTKNVLLVMILMIQNYFIFLKNCKGKTILALIPTVPRKVTEKFICKWWI